MFTIQIRKIGNGQAENRATEEPEENHGEN